MQQPNLFAQGQPGVGGGMPMHPQPGGMHPAFGGGMQQPGGMQPGMQPFPAFGRRAFSGTNTPTGQSRLGGGMQGMQGSQGPLGQQMLLHGSSAGAGASGTPQLLGGNSATGTAPVIGSERFLYCIY